MKLTRPELSICIAAVLVVGLFCAAYGVVIMGGNDVPEVGAGVSVEVDPIYTAAVSTIVFTNNATYTDTVAKAASAIQTETDPVYTAAVLTIVFTNTPTYTDAVAKAGSAIQTEVDPVYTSAIPTIVFTNTPAYTDAVAKANSAIQTEVDPVYTSAIPTIVFTNTPTYTDAVAKAGSAIQALTPWTGTISGAGHSLTGAVLGAGVSIGTGALVGFVGRGDPSVADYTTNNLTADAAWHDLDLSSIVPSGAKFIYINFVLTDSATSQALLLRKNGNTNAVLVVRCETMVANLATYGRGWVACDTNQIIEYLISAGMDSLSLTVNMWSYGP